MNSTAKHAQIGVGPGRFWIRIRFSAQHVFEQDAMRAGVSTGPAQLMPVDSFRPRVAGARGEMVMPAEPAAAFCSGTQYPPQASEVIRSPRPDVR